MAMPYDWCMLVCAPRFRILISFSFSHPKYREVSKQMPVLHITHHVPKFSLHLSIPFMTWTLCFLIDFMRCNIFSPLLINWFSHRIFDFVCAVLEWVIFRIMIVNGGGAASAPTTETVCACVQFTSPIMAWIYVPVWQHFVIKLLN